MAEFPMPADVTKVTVGSDEFEVVDGAVQVPEDLDPSVRRDLERISSYQAAEAPAEDEPADNDEVDDEVVDEVDLWSEGDND